MEDGRVGEMTMERLTQEAYESWQAAANALIALKEAIHTLRFTDREIITVIGLLFLASEGWQQKYQKYERQRPQANINLK